MLVVFGLMMMTLASGLTLYMLVNALTSILQQFYINKKLGAPNVQSLAIGTTK